MPNFLKNTDIFPLTLTGLDSKTTGATLIGTTPNDGTRFYPLFLVTELTSVSVPVSVASLSIGTNSASYNNILAITALTAQTTANLIIVTPLALTVISSVAPNTGIYVNITTGAVATTAVISLRLVGYYI